MKPQTVMVLGGGFAGLSAAIHLAAKGIEVTLLEQAPSLGGKAAQYSRDGYRFDTGPSVFTLKHVLEDVFKVAGEDMSVVLEPLDLLCRYLFPSGRVWDVYSETAKTTAQLSKKEAEVYSRLVQKARALYEAAAPTFVYGQAPGIIDLMRYGLKDGLKARPFSSLPQLLDSYGATGDLKQFFLRFATYFGADPYRAPAVLHNIAYAELGQGVYYPRGGIYQVVEALAELAKQLGVQIKTGERVERLELAGHQLKHVHTDRSMYSVEAVVSSLDIIRTHTLMGRRAKQVGLEPSLSGFVLLLGVRAVVPQVAHHTISFGPAYRAEFESIHNGQFPRDPTLYLNVSSKTDSNDAPAGRENWFVMANAPALKQGWPLEEEAYKAEVLASLEQRGLLSLEQLDFVHMLGPSYLAGLAHAGSIYGAAPHSLLQTLRPKQRVAGVANLVLAGGSVYPGGGMPLALLSGKAAAELVLAG